MSVEGLLIFVYVVMVPLFHRNLILIVVCGSGIQFVLSILLIIL